MRTRWNEKTIYLSELENNLLKNKSRKLNLNHSEYIRNLLNNYEPKNTNIDIIAKHLEDLKMIGKALNIIIRDSHRYNFIDTKRLDYHLVWINDIIEDISVNLELD